MNIVTARRRRERGECAECGELCTGYRCRLHKDRNTGYRRERRIRLGQYQGTKCCSFCLQPGHYRSTCPLEPTR